MRHTIVWLTMLCVALYAGTASAWLETRIVSAAATVDVSADGQAAVVHEIVLKTRGERLKSLSLQGVEAYAEFFPDSTVTAVEGSSEAVALLGERADDGTLLLEIEHPRGLKAGRYVFRFGYRTNLLARKRLMLRKGVAELTWVGPRFEDGIDSAKVVFRLPPAKTPPTLPILDDKDADSRFEREFDGTLLSQLRRTADKDEIELVRPHVARGEPATWRIIVSPKAFPAFAGSTGVASRAEPAQSSAVLRGQAGVRLALLLTVFALYSALLAFRWRFFQRACALRELKARALVPLPASLRIPLAGLLLTSGLGLGQEPENGALFGAFLLGALVLTTLKRPTLPTALRGPGQWVRLRAHSAFDVRRRLPEPYFLDPSSVTGCALFVLLLVLSAGVSYVNLSRSPYHALLVLLASAVLLPIFWTGRAADLPLSPALRAVPFLRRLWTRLRKDRQLQVVPFGRVPNGQDEPDELRLLVNPVRPRPGFKSMEVALEYTDATRDSIANPLVLVRVLDDSESYRAMPYTMIWSRGRSSHERVAVIRLALPSVRLCASTVKQLALQLSQGSVETARSQNTMPPRSATPYSPTRRAKASGTASRACKGAIRASLQPM